MILQWSLAGITIPWMFVCDNGLENLSQLPLVVAPWDTCLDLPFDQLDITVSGLESGSDAVTVAHEGDVVHDDVFMIMD